MSFKKQDYVNTMRLGASGVEDLDIGETRVARMSFEAFTQIAGGDAYAGASSGAISFLALHRVQSDGGMLLEQSKVIRRRFRPTLAWGQPTPARMT